MSGPDVSPSASKDRPVEDPEPAPGDRDESLIDRRTVLRRGAAAGGALVLAPAAVARIAARASVRGATARPQPRPNILVILVDQLRAPQGFQKESAAAKLMPNLARLRSGGVSFASHYTAANDCTPSRSALITGLYTHQTGCLITGGSTLPPIFPTWGKMLRDHGYVTAWFGKWHLTHGDDQWTQTTGRRALEQYGFGGGTFPSPDGSPGQGWRVDPLIADQFTRWYATAPADRPWCTTVSLVNPHDIAWWYRGTSQIPAERSAPVIVRKLPANFETPAQLIAGGKPNLQRSLQETAANAFGPVQYTGPAALRSWLPFMNLYLKLSAEVDRQIGAVMKTLARRPTLAANTVVVFTSDHGEYGGSHGLRGKGAGVYEEAIKVPLVVKDLRAGKITRAPAVDRTGLTSSVDVAPMLLTLATGSSAWRSESRYSQIAGRHDLAAMLSDPKAPGRPYVLHATDEILSEYAISFYAFTAPLHVVAIRTPTAKYAVYSDWNVRSDAVLTVGEQRELYDYSSRRGRLELDNRAGRSTLEDALDAQLTEAIASELHEPLPPSLFAPQVAGYVDYYRIAQEAAIAGAAHRRNAAKLKPPSRATRKLA